MTEATESTAPESLSFEQALTRLEGIVHDLEEGQIGLAEALARYEQGVALLRCCHALLENAERKIELLTGADGQGRAVVEPFGEPAAADLSEKAASRSRRRTAPRPTSPPVDTPPAFDMDSGGGLF